MSENIPTKTPEIIQKTYKPPECRRIYEDPAFDNVDDFDACDKVINKKTGDKCCAPKYCHPSSPHPLCKLTRQDIESNEAKYMTTNGLCVPCLQMKVCCLAAAHPSKESFSSLANNSSELILRRIEDKLSFTYEEVTPSILGSSKHFKSFASILSTLGLLEPSLPEPLNIKLNFQILNRSNEFSLFSPLLTYLNTNTTNYSIKNISNGQDLINGNLFHTTIHTLKPEAKTSLELGLEKPRKIVDIRGRTDIVCFEKNTVPSPTSTIYGIELKLKVTQLAIREAIGQLLGLNIENHLRSPGIILTDLLYHCLLLYLDCVEEGVNYNLCLIPFDNFDAAILAAIQIGTRKSVTRNFARRPTPPPTPDKLNVFLENFVNSDDELVDDD